MLFFILVKYFIYVFTFGCAGLGCYMGFSLVLGHVGCSLVGVHELLVAVASLGHPGSQYCGMWASRAQAQ